MAEVFNKKSEYELLNLARFVGALWVLLFHANIHFGETEALHFINPILNQGVLGMTVFFVLSGFVLSLRYTLFDTDFATRGFYLARIIRLYPVYVLMGAVTFPTLFLAADDYTYFQSHPLLWGMALIGIFILALQAWAPSLFSLWNFGGSWSLSVETFFYATFPKLRSYLTKLPDHKLFAIIVSCIFTMLGILILLIVQEGSRSQQVIFYVLPIFRYPEFILGAAIYILCVEKSAFQKTLNCASIPLFIFGLMLIYNVDLPGYLDFGFLFALPIAMLYVLSMRFRSPLFLRMPFNYLGHISYCLYIVQFGTVPYLKNFLDIFSPGFSWIIFVILTFIFANIVHFVIEVPAHSYLKRKFKQNPS